MSIKLNSFASALLIAGIALNISTNVKAGLFDDVKNKIKNKTSQEANKEVKKHAGKQTNKINKTAQQAGTSSVSLGQPSTDLTSMVQCSSLKLTNVMVGNVDDYTFQQGFSKEERSGFINRRAGNVSSGCILPSLQPSEYMYMEVDTDAYKAIGSSGWEMQCVKSADPGAGAVNESEPKGEFAYKADFISEKDMMLNCGNSEGIEQCIEGSNGDRASGWSKHLKATGKSMFSVMAVRSTLAPAGGEKLFCHYYHKPSRKSMFAFEYLRIRG